MIYKLNEEVEIYKIGEVLYVRSDNQIFEFEDIGDLDYILRFIKKLAKGISVSDIDKACKFEEVSEFYAFLKENVFLEELGDGVDTKEFNFNLLLNEELVIKKKKDLQSLKIGILESGVNDFDRLIIDSFVDSYIKVRSINKIGNVDLLIHVKSQKQSEKDILKVNEICIQKNIICLYVDLSLGSCAVVGPLVVPNKTACYKCLTERKLINDDIITKHDLQRKQVVVKGTNDMFCHQKQIISGLIVEEVLNYFLNINARCLNGLVYFDLKKIETWRESLLIYPNCKVCKI